MRFKINRRKTQLALYRINTQNHRYIRFFFNKAGSIFSSRSGGSLTSETLEIKNMESSQSEFKIKVENYELNAIDSEGFDANYFANEIFNPDEENQEYNNSNVKEENNDNEDFNWVSFDPDEENINSNVKEEKYENNNFNWVSFDTEDEEMDDIFQRQAEDDYSDKFHDNDSISTANSCPSSQHGGNGGQVARVKGGMDIKHRGNAEYVIVTHDEKVYSTPVQDCKAAVEEKQVRGINKFAALMIRREQRERKALEEKEKEYKKRENENAGWNFCPAPVKDHKPSLEEKQSGHIDKKKRKRKRKAIEEKKRENENFERKRKEEDSDEKSKKSKLKTFPIKTVPGGFDENIEASSALSEEASSALSEEAHSVLSEEARSTLSEEARSVLSEGLIRMGDKGGFLCTVCESTVLSIKTLKQHYLSEKHLKRLNKKMEEEELKDKIQILTVIKIDPSWPIELVKMFSNSMCYLCNKKIYSEQGAIGHYQSGKHAIKIRLFLAKHNHKNQEKDMSWTYKAPLNPPQYIRTIPAPGCSQSYIPPGYSTHSIFSHTANPPYSYYPHQWQPPLNPGSLSNNPVIEYHRGHMNQPSLYDGMADLRLKELKKNKVINKFNGWFASKRTKPWF